MARKSPPPAAAAALAKLKRVREELAAERQKRRDLEAMLIGISEREQRRFGQELHDGACQSMSALAILAGLLAKKIRAVTPQYADELEKFSAGLRRLIDETRAIARNLHPGDLHDGISSALESMAADVSAKMPCAARCRKIPGLSGETQLAILRIAQEAIGNALHHARASRLVIRLERKDSQAILRVEDDGIGIPPELPRNNRPGMGLDMMGYRASLLGGALVVERRKEGGTRVAAFFPLGKQLRRIEPNGRRTAEKKLIARGGKGG